MVVVVTALVLGLGPSLSCGHGGCGGGGGGGGHSRRMVVVVGRWAMVTAAVVIDAGGGRGRCLVPGGVVDASATSGGHDALCRCCCATLASHTVNLSSLTVVWVAGVVAAFVCACTIRGTVLVRFKY